MDGTTIGFLAAIAATAGVTLDRLLGRRSIGRKLDEFLSDWNGTPERPGVARRPGVLERLGSHDAALAVVESRTAQLERNGGTSLADTVHDIARQAATNERRLADIAREVVEAQVTAGKAAVTAARVEEGNTHGQQRIVSALEEMRDRIWERITEQDDQIEQQKIRELTYVSMLHELGIDLALPDDD